MEMPFGKYRGNYIDEIPTSYLSWLWRNANLFGALRDAVYEELRTREAREEFANSGASSGTSVSVIDAKQIQRIYRTLAFRWHPDRGGSTSAMQAVNEFYDELNQLT